MIGLWLVLFLEVLRSPQRQVVLFLREIPCRSQSLKVLLRGVTMTPRVRARGRRTALRQTNRVKGKRRPLVALGVRRSGRRLLILRNTGRVALTRTFLTPRRTTTFHMRVGIANFRLIFVILEVGSPVTVVIVDKRVYHLFGGGKIPLFW